MYPCKIQPLSVVVLVGKKINNRPNSKYTKNPNSKFVAF